jgi:hypothetical protein
MDQTKNNVYVYVKSTLVIGETTLKSREDDFKNSIKMI